MGCYDNNQVALQQSDIFMDRMTSMTFVEVTDDGNGNDVATVSGNNVPADQQGPLQTKAGKAGNGTGFYVQDTEGGWHCVSNMAGGQWYQQQMQHINDGAQKVATAVTTMKGSIETIKRAYT